MIVQDRVLRKIKQEKIKPLPPTIFLIKRVAFWFLTILSFLLTALITSLVIFLLANQDWDIYQKFTSHQTLFLFWVLPYFWLIIWFIFIWSLYYNYRHTKYGYRTKISQLTIFSSTLILIFGYTFYSFGWGYKIENYFFQKSNFYNQINNNRLIWDNATKGLLAGQIIKTEKSQIILKDLKNKEWQIIFNQLDTNSNLIPGQKIKIIGQPVDSQTFFASEIRNWCGCGGCLESNNLCANGCNH
ncbi:MAG TPA: hypothetical protein PKZ16_03345 [bacterium]|nr:hypothetical protein [bacterium]HPL95378.1 hypothetical protein [bacterium]